MQPSRRDFSARLFQALASPVRLHILELLRASGSMTVSEIHQRLGIEPANASQHLAVLRDRGLVERRREGASAWYSIADPALYRLIDAASAVFEHHTGARSRRSDAPPVPRRASHFSR